MRCMQTRKALEGESIGIVRSECEKERVNSKEERFFKYSNFFLIKRTKLLYISNCPQSISLDPRMSFLS